MDGVGEKYFSLVGAGRDVENDASHVIEFKIYGAQIFICLARKLLKVAR